MGGWWITFQRTLSLGVGEVWRRALPAFVRFLALFLCSSFPSYTIQARTWISVYICPICINALDLRETPSRLSLHNNALSLRESASRLGLHNNALDLREAPSRLGLHKCPLLGVHKCL